VGGSQEPDCHYSPLAFRTLLLFSAAGENFQPDSDAGSEVGVFRPVRMRAATCHFASLSHLLTSHCNPRKAALLLRSISQAFAAKNQENSW